MSAPGRPQVLIPDARRAEGTPMSAPGRPKGESEGLRPEASQ